MELIYYIGDSKDHFLGSLVFMGVMAWAIATVIESWRGGQ